MSKWHVISSVSAVLLIGCSALPEGGGKKLRDDYIQKTRELGLVPVYPPSEEYQVGDVFFVSYPENRFSTVEETASIHLGTLNSLRQAANAYLASRINYSDSVADQSSLQADFAAGGVALNSAARTSLPLVSYPAIEGAASSAASFGGFGFGSSFGLGLGQTETVSINFNDTRAYGMPLGAFSLDLANFGAEYSNVVCGTQPTRAASRAFQVLKFREVLKNSADMCRNGRKCEFRAITRTIRTRNISYTYTGSRISSLAASTALGTLPENPQATVSVPSQVNLGVTLGQEATPAQIQALVSAITASTSGTAPSTPKNSLSFVGFQGNSMKFDRNLQKPVAVAYEAITYDLDGDAASCNLIVDKETGAIRYGGGANNG